jgi:sortase A
VTAPQVEQAVPRPLPSRAWSAVGVVGELLITVGVLLLLFVAYQLLWTNVTAQRAADQVASDLQDSWSRPPAPGGEGDTDGEGDTGDQGDATPEDARPEIGDAFALMFIPRLRDKVWGLPVLETVALPDLARGIGHYPQSQLPGEKGNFAVAAHRATNGEPFRDIDRLQVGDRVYVETKDSWFEYTLRRDQIVGPSATWVIDPVPFDPGATPTQRLVTLTTCNPRWGHTTRWIWWGDLTTRYAKADGQVPPEIEAGR